MRVGGPGPSTGWVVRDGWLDAAGHRIGAAEEAALLREAGGVPASDYLTARGLRPWTE